MPVPPFAALLSVARAGRAWMATVPDGAFAHAHVLPASTIGAQYRHHLDYLEALLVGLNNGRVDYDGRARDPRCETERAVALQRAEALEGQLEQHIAAGATHSGTEIAVRECCDPDQPSPWLQSTVGREVAAVIAHAIHHYAVLAITARACGIAVDDSFALAPATRRYRANSAPTLTVSN